MHKVNKGEWSEFYVFLKILCDRKLSAVDRNLSVIPGKFFAFHRLIREEIPWLKRIYNLVLENPHQVQILNKDNIEVCVYENHELSSKTKAIFERIKNSNERTFCIEEAEVIMKQLLCRKVKASSQKKEDIVWVIDDRISENLVELGFSIKSMVWAPSTLLNAGDNTNFVFKIVGFTGDIDRVNTIDTHSKIRDRLKKIKEMWGELIFKEVKDPIFASNLRRIDTIFARIFATMIVDFFSWKGNSVPDLTNLLAENKLLAEYWFSGWDFEYKVKNFLDAIALWMTAGKEWSGAPSAKGGYIVVKEDWEVVCYHLYDREEFRGYLFSTTKFDTPSSTKHNFGTLYMEEWELCFNLNIQVRF